MPHGRARSCQAPRPMTSRAVSARRARSREVVAVTQRRAEQRWAALLARVSARLAKAVLAKEVRRLARVRVRAAYRAAGLSGGRAAATASAAVAHKRVQTQRFMGPGIRAARFIGSAASVLAHSIDTGGGHVAASTSTALLAFAAAVLADSAGAQAIAATLRVGFAPHPGATAAFAAVARRLNVTAGAGRVRVARLVSTDAAPAVRPGDRSRPLPEAGVAIAPARASRLGVLRIAGSQAFAEGEAVRRGALAGQSRFTGPASTSGVAVAPLTYRPRADPGDVTADDIARDTGLVAVRFVRA
jgi:hypothetical protein